MIRASSPAITGKAEPWLRLAILALVFAVALALGACSERADDSEQARGSRPAASPLFYEIAREDGSARGWMLGTIHALPEGTAWRTPAISDAMGKADRLVVEVAALDDAEAMARTFRQLATTPDLPLLAARVPAARQSELAVVADRAGLGPSQQRQTESWAASLILARVNALGDPANGVDRALLRTFANRPVRELEGVRGQLGIFDRLSEAEQRAMLLAVLDASKQGQREAEALQSAWLLGDVAALEAASQRGIMADPRLRDALLIKRNQRWLPLIENELAGPGRPLIAIGAAHLVGPDGLVALLEARGWRLIRLT